MVTLEPCNHHGRTPPCRQALIDADVGRVVISVIDPTSRGEGGAAALRSAGISVETGVLRDEALVVLGPWLTALEKRRPEITWPYLITPVGIEALPEGTPESDFLRRNADAVLNVDGTATEAVPGAHGAGILKLAVPAGAGALEVANFLYEGGVRRLLLQGGQDLATSFIVAGVLDRVLAYTTGGPASHRPASYMPWPELPPGFTVTASTASAPVAAMEDTARGLYGVQFHPEVAHTEHGLTMLKHFLTAAGCRPSWTMVNIVEESVEAVRSQVGGKRARPAYRSIVLGILLAVVGVVVLVLGVWFQQPLVGILGFVVMFAGVLVAIAPGKRVAVEPGAPEPKRAKARGGQTGFMDRMNDRWDKRNDGGEG